MPVKSAHRIRNKNTPLKRPFSLFPPPAFLRMPAAGLDISETSIKLAELVPTADGMRLGRFGEHVLPLGIIEGGRVVDTDALASALNEIQRAHALSFAHVSLPEQQSYVFQAIIPMPSDGRDIRNAIEFQLEENVPLHGSEALFDYAVIRKEHDHVAVSVAVYPRALIETYLAALRRAHLIPLSVDIEGAATGRAVIRRGDSKTYMIADCARTRTTLSIFGHGALLLSTTIPIGGESFTSIIAKHQNGSFEEAEKIKRERGIATTEYTDMLRAELADTARSLRDEIHKYVVYWKDREAALGLDAPVDALILTGGGANLKGLPEYLAGHIQLPVERANVWSNALSLEEYVPPIPHARALSYATAAGLALRGALS